MTKKVQVYIPPSLIQFAKKMEIAGFAFNPHCSFVTAMAPQTTTHHYKMAALVLVAKRLPSVSTILVTAILAVHYSSRKYS